MITRCVPPAAAFCVLFASLVCLADPVGPASAKSASAKSKTAPNTPVVLNEFTASTRLRDGIEVRSGRATIKITALRDDVLRIRIASTGEMPEDASWAVLDSARHESANVTQEDSADHVGFRTASLRVRIDRPTMRLQITDLQGNVLQEDAEGWPVTFHNGSFRLYKKMPDDEHYFGLGDKVGPLDRREQAFALWNTDAFGFQESTDPIYKAIPFFLTMRGGRATGVLLDNTWRSSFDFGKENRGTYSFGAQNGALDYYVLYGPDPKHVLTTYTWLTGPTPLPPLWTFGYQQSRYSYETESRLREVAAKLRADKIPCDALYLDIDYQKNNRPFTVDTNKFPHFGPMLTDLKTQKFHVVAITDLHIAHLPGQGYAPYDSGVAGDHFVKNPDGSIYVGEVWPGPSSFPDFTRDVTREWWGALYTDFVSLGVAGFWNDMNEPAVFKTPTKTMPDDVQHRIEGSGFHSRTTSHLEIHNVFGMENSRGTYEGLLKLSPDQRPFVLTRASYAGGQRYAATWTGDNSSTWNHLRLTTPMLLNLGLSGFGLTGADVGGFAGTPQPDLLTKWIEIAAFQPIDRNHAEKGSADREPWVHGPEQENIRRRYIEERYRLMPYIYTTGEEMSRSGLPIVRPLFLEFPNDAPDGHPPDIDVGNEFMFGPDLLVAPAPYPDKLSIYPVMLPQGDWYDYWTGERRTSGEKISPTLEVLPVFVRGGSIIPMQPLTQSTDEIPDGPLTLRVYPGQDCKGTLYQDDGKTMAYKRGEFMRMNFSCEVQAGTLKLHISSHEGNFKTWWNQIRFEVAIPQAEQLQIKQAPGPRTSATDTGHHVFAFTVPDDGRGADVEVGWQN